jgi:hypothetical protein
MSREAAVRLLGVLGATLGIPDLQLDGNRCLPGTVRVG